MKKRTCKTERLVGFVNDFSYALECGKTILGQKIFNNDEDDSLRERYSEADDWEEEDQMVLAENVEHETYVEILRDNSLRL